jgi:hypothetical protein
MESTTEVAKVLAVRAERMQAVLLTTRCGSERRDDKVNTHSFADEARSYNVALIWMSSNEVSEHQDSEPVLGQCEPCTESSRDECADKRVERVVGDRPDQGDCQGESGREMRPGPWENPCLGSC